MSKTYLNKEQKELILSMLDCGYCVLEGKEVKKCATRRDLMDCNVDFLDAGGECPYRAE